MSQQTCFTSLVGLVDKTDSRPFGDSPKRTHVGFDCKVKHPAVNLERQVRRHRTADSPRLFFVRHGPFVAIRVTEKNAYRTVFTPRKDPLRPPPVLAADGRRDQAAVVPAVAAPPTSSLLPPGPEHHYACSETGTASTR